MADHISMAAATLINFVHILALLNLQGTHFPIIPTDPKILPTVQLVNPVIINIDPYTIIIII